MSQSMCFAGHARCLHAIGRWPRASREVCPEPLFDWRQQRGVEESREETVCLRWPSMRSFLGSRAILSGPAAGVVGYARSAHLRFTRQPLIGFDMGGALAVRTFGNSHQKLHMLHKSSEFWLTSHSLIIRYNCFRNLNGREPFRGRTRARLRDIYRWS